jgi:predicted glycogen debranching enzyme
MFAISGSALSPAIALRREWLVANGIGGYASSTITGCNVRKYHGLLIAAGDSPQDRKLLLSKLEESVAIGGKRFELSTNHYPNTIFPEGYRHLKEFRFTSHPEFTFGLDGAFITKSVRMLKGKNATVISYKYSGKGAAELELRPLINSRGIHEDYSQKKFSTEAGKHGVEIKKPERFSISSSDLAFSPSEMTYYNMEYPIEAERGYLHREDHFSPGIFKGSITNGEEIHLAASDCGLSATDAHSEIERQASRQQKLSDMYFSTNSIEQNDFGRDLCHAADTFIVDWDGRHSIVAGYHWFGEWGRDAMISLPGLCLSTGRYALAREILLRFSSTIRRGLLPNYFDERGKPHYDSADAALWFLNAVHHYTAQTGDYAFVRAKLWPKMKEIIHFCMHGNEILSMDDDALLFNLDPRCTWMDASADGGPVTPRKGKPVEINALWYSGLVLMSSLSERFSEPKNTNLYRDTIFGVKGSFQKFWNTREACLYDVIEPNEPSVRPNQIFAVGLPFSPLSEVQQRLVLTKVRDELYTPIGLRTLAQHDQNYHNYYAGNERARNLSYHQGAIWPWLLGAFFDAHLRVFPNSEGTVLKMLSPFSEQLSHDCVGHIGELYEPATLESRGAIAQAWSVAEILRIYTKAKIGEASLSNFGKHSMPAASSISAVQ